MARCSSSIASPATTATASATSSYGRARMTSPANDVWTGSVGVPGVASLAASTNVVSRPASACSIVKHGWPACNSMAPPFCAAVESIERSVASWAKSAPPASSATSTSASSSDSTRMWPTHVAPTSVGDALVAVLHVAARRPPWPERGPRRPPVRRARRRPPARTARSDRSARAPRAPRPGPRRSPAPRRRRRSRRSPVLTMRKSSNWRPVAPSSVPVAASLCTVGAVPVVRLPSSCS